MQYLGHINMVIEHSQLRLIADKQRFDEGWLSCLKLSGTFKPHAKLFNFNGPCCPK